MLWTIILAAIVILILIKMTMPKAGWWAYAAVVVAAVIVAVLVSRPERSKDDSATEKTETPKKKSSEVFTIYLGGSDVSTKIVSCEWSQWVPVTYGAIQNVLQLDRNDLFVVFEAMGGVDVVNTNSITAQFPNGGGPCIGCDNPLWRDAGGKYFSAIAYSSGAKLRFRVSRESPCSLE